VDGERVDVTPFARAIPLRPGSHYAALVHPNAPIEKRTIEVVSGETKTLDVVMSVAGVTSKESNRATASH
jgi:serine/threonine-protein kinase